MQPLFACQHLFACPAAMFTRRLLQTADLVPQGVNLFQKLRFGGIFIHYAFRSSDCPGKSGNRSSNRKNSSAKWINIQFEPGKCEDSGSAEKCPFKIDYSITAHLCRMGEACGTHGITHLCRMGGACGTHGITHLCRMGGACGTHRITVRQHIDNILNNAMKHGFVTGSL